MKKTTVYLPDDVKSALTKSASRRGVSEAELIRSAVAAAVGDERPRPNGGLFRGRSPIAENVDEYLAGFGER